MHVSNPKADRVNIYGSSHRIALNPTNDTPQYNIQWSNKNPKLDKIFRFYFKH